ncbi:MAG: DPP IV N-terminal domain-containing protein [Acidobacteriota bacterium]
MSRCAAVRRSFLCLLLCLPFAASVTASETAGAEEESFLRQYAETFRFRLGAPSAVQITPNGDAVLFLRSGSRDFVRNLYLFDPATGEERRLLTAGDILGGAEEELTDEEKARRERMRLAARGIAGFSLSSDGETLLAPLSGRLFLVRWRTGAVRELPVAGGFPIDPRLTPDDRRVVYVAGGDLYVIDVAPDGEEQSPPRRLTSSATETVSNGLAEFVAQEEMRRRRGYWMSPDSAWLVYQQTDVADVETFYIPDPADPGKAPQTWPYPRPGKTNADVRLGLLSLDGGATQWIDWDRDAFPYLNTVRWGDGAPLVAQVQDRRQNTVVLLAVDPETGATRELMRETDDAWINLDQDVPHWLPGGDRFLWTSEREGAWRLELRRADGSLERALTALDFGYDGLVHVDAEREEVIVRASEDPTETHLWRVPFSGGEPERLTREAGVHDAKVSDDGSLMVLRQSPAEGPSRAVVARRDGTRLGQLTSMAETPRFEVAPEFVTVGADPSFHAVMVRPGDFDAAQRYPVILSVYGGPHAQTVKKTQSRYAFHQWIADQGYVVVSIDGRGTPRRGRAWERTIKYNFIDQPLADQISALQALGARFPEMDLERVGIYGWSFGGYFSAMATMRHPEIFDVGVAGAPVTDWQDYDTHYTERYIGLPGEHPEAYQVSNVLTYADQLEKPLLIIHGTADDNVYFVHALKMSDALLRSGKEHEFLTLSGQTHMVTEPTIVERMYQRMIDLFDQHLGDPEPAS